jgi:hypothetical protein
MVYFQTKNPNLVNFGGPLNGKCWYIVCPFGIFYGDLVLFVEIWYISPRFGILCQEKYGNPGPDLVVQVHTPTQLRKIISLYHQLV